MSIFTEFHKFMVDCCGVYVAESVRKCIDENGEFSPEKRANKDDMYIDVCVGLDLPEFLYHMKRHGFSALSVKRYTYCTEYFVSDKNNNKLSIVNYLTIDERCNKLQTDVNRLSYDTKSYKLQVHCSIPLNEILEHIKEKKYVKITNYLYAMRELEDLKFWGFEKIENYTPSKVEAPQAQVDVPCRVCGRNVYATDSICWNCETPNPGV